MENIKKIPAYEGSEAFIFVSYAHKDTELVLNVVDKLFKEKYRIWYDEGIAPGSEWPKNIETHLNKAELILIFVSNNSLESINCENEVKNSLNKKVIEFQIDSKHKLLEDKISVSSYEELLSKLDNKLIGDGVSGYESEIHKGKGSLWNILLILAFALFVLLGAGLYGLNAGYFDSYLPGLAAISEYNTPIIEDNSVDITQIDKTLQNAIFTNLGNEKYLEEIDVEDEYAKNSFLNSLGYFEWGEGPFTYGDLINFDADDLHFEYLNNETIEFIPYLKNLKTLRIETCEENLNLDVLNNCLNLELVIAGIDCFPFEISQDMNFNLAIMN